jgi:hypothetical protein
MFKVKYVKIKLLKIEIFLLAGPVLLLVPQWLFFRGVTIDVHFHDTMILIPVFQVLAGIFLIQVLYFFMHRILRSLKKRNVYVCSIHVVGTGFFLLLTCIPIFIFSRPPHEESPYELIRYVLLRERFNWVGTFSLIVFVSLHILFLLYFSILVVRNILVRRPDK